MVSCGSQPPDSSVFSHWRLSGVTPVTRRRPPRARRPPPSGSTIARQPRSPRTSRRQRKPVSAALAEHIFTRASAALCGSTCRRSAPTAGRSRSPTYRSACGFLSASAIRTGVDKPAPSSPTSRVIGPPMSALQPTPVANPRIWALSLVGKSDQAEADRRVEDDQGVSLMSTEPDSWYDSRCRRRDLENVGQKTLCL